MKVAAIQYRPPKGQPALARAALAERVADAVAQGARLVVCPEMATSGYVWPDAESIRPHAEPAQGPTLAALSEAGRGAWVVCGYPERDGERLYNAALVIDPSGALVCSYRKALLYEADKPWALPGDRHVIVRTAFGRMLPAICMDLNDDRLLRSLIQAQPDVLAFCTNWVEEGIDVWPYWRRRRGPWAGVMIAANTWGTDEGVRFSGRSAIFGPDHAALASAGPEGDAILVAEVPLKDTGAPA